MLTGLRPSALKTCFKSKMKSDGVKCPNFPQIWAFSHQPRAGKTIIRVLAIRPHSRQAGLPWRSLLGFRSALQAWQDTGRLQLNVRTVVDLVLQGVQFALKFLRGLVDTSKLEHDL
jgi:hypothetical protein